MSEGNAKRGFTLIELLVVVAIIGLLSSVVLSSLSVARSKARDAQRKAQIDQFTKALQIYYTSYGVYPCAASTCSTPVANFIGTGFAGQALLTAGAIGSIPSDPSYSDATSCNALGTGYCYCSNGGDSYVLTVNTEDDEGGSDRCYIEHGPNAATHCQGHHNGLGEIAEGPCSNRF